MVKLTGTSIKNINLKKLLLTLLSSDLEVNDCGFNFDISILVSSEIL